MEVGQLYQFVLLLVIVGIVLGVGIKVLDSLGSGLTGAASTSVNNTRDALGPIASTWLPIIVIVAVAAIILTLVIRSFGAGGRR